MTCLRLSSIILRNMMIEYPEDSMISFLARHHRKIRDIGIGLVLFESFSNFFDFAIYPIALIYWGPSLGGSIMIGVTLLINVVIFWLYEYMRVDWLGAHALRQLEQEENKSNIHKLMTWIGKKKVHWWEKLLNPIVFAVLLLPIDPVIIAIHYRREHFKGIPWRDWGILFLATLVANLWWILKIEVVIQAVLYLWRLVF